MFNRHGDREMVIHVNRHVDRESVDSCKSEAILEYVNLGARGLKFVTGLSIENGTKKSK